MNTEVIRSLILSVRLPDSDRTLASYRAECCIEDASGSLKIDLTLPFPLIGTEQALRETIRSILIENHLSIQQINFNTRITTHKVKNALQTLDGVKNIIAVASGKGGVGKSTTTANLAAAVALSGACVGVLDADLYGPSQPLMFDAVDAKPDEKNQMFLPIVRNGIQLMSVGFLIDSSRSLIWRGPLISRALQQLFFQTAWDNVDYLFIDLPPGTGDIQLTLTQKMPVTGAVIVTTPQNVALSDAQKGIDMFNKTGIPVLGILENMSQHICSKCGHIEPIFGQDGGKKLAQRHNVPLLGQLPLTLPVRDAMDKGNPFSLLRDYPDIATIYRTAAQKLVCALADTGKDYSHVFPKMVVAPA